MMKSEMLANLRCPESGSTLALGDAAFVEGLNDLIRGGCVKNRAGRAVGYRIDAALIRAEGDIVYPVVDEIPMLLRDEGIIVKELIPAND